MKNRIFVISMVLILLSTSFVFAGNREDYFTTKWHSNEEIARSVIEYGVRYSKTTVPKELEKVKKQYPNGESWDITTAYYWNGGVCMSKGEPINCIGFALYVSDKIFGSIPARVFYEFNPRELRVGDLVCMNDGEFNHIFVVYKVKKNHIVVAEANYIVEWEYSDGTPYVEHLTKWNRKISYKYLKKHGLYMVTRYPDTWAYRFEVSA